MGVNDSAPSHTLDVSGDINLTGDIRSNGSIWNPSPSITSGYVAYGTGSGITGESALFWDSNNNRLGINNTTPLYTLDVTGDINFTGSLNNNGS